MDLNDSNILLNLLPGLGGEYDGDKKIEDLKLLFRAYVTDALSDGRMENNKVTSLWWILFLGLGE